jgi:hypothetical protein
MPSLYRGEAHTRTVNADAKLEIRRNGKKSTAAQLQWSIADGTDIAEPMISEGFAQSAKAANVAGRGVRGRTSRLIISVANNEARALYKAGQAGIKWFKRMSLFFRAPLPNGSTQGTLKDRAWRPRGRHAQDKPMG